ncbi:hypothetical protein PVAG01_05018 [Phlyctema vagabunda]|uniref:Uncharacterized protein n=1 Tax=Phlyctema vagabunda TaxID=108571 RepID=A0ABR4PIV6_9HELO
MGRSAPHSRTSYSRSSVSTTPRHVERSSEKREMGKRKKVGVLVLLAIIYKLWSKKHGSEREPERVRHKRHSSSNSSGTSRRSDPRYTGRDRWDDETLVDEGRRQYRYRHHY